MTALASVVVSVGALLLGLFVAEAHAADAPVATLRLDVQAEPGCSSYADLSARVLSRLPRLRFVADSPALVARVRLSTLPAGNAVGELTLAKPGAKATERRVVARSCTQVADALALIIAVTIDPNSLSEAAATDPGDRAEALSASADRAAPAADAARRAALERVPASQSAATVPILGADASSLRLGLSLAGQGLVGAAPGFMKGGALYVFAGTNRESHWSPALMLGLTHAWKSGLSERGGTAKFALDALSLDACGVRSQAGAVEARACASLLVGRLSAEGSDTQNSPGPVRRPFAATGATALVTGRLHANVELVARVAVGVNWVRDSFEFAPFVFYSVPAVTASAGLGLGFRTE